MIRTTRISLRRLAALCGLLSLLGITLLFSPHRTISGKGKGSPLGSAAQKRQEPPLPPHEAALRGRRRTGQNSVPRPLAAGGPDAFGYTFITNQPPPPIIPNTFIDISATGTPLGSGDNVSFTATLMQPFTFYGASYAALQISTNGYISTDLTDLGSDASNDCPLPAPPSSGGGGRIYALHGDLVVGDFSLPPPAFDPTARILTQFFPVCPRVNDITGAPEACTVIMWDNARFYCEDDPSAEPPIVCPANPPTFDFETILYHTTDEIVVQFATGNPDDGANTTTGIQNPAATSGLTVACNTANSIPDNFAVAFIPPCPTITCPVNIIVPNTPGQCNASVNYSPPTGSMCGPIRCDPPSGSTFNVGTTPVNCRAFNANACDTLYGLTLQNELVTFSAATPGTVSTPVPLQVMMGETVAAIDFRPANGLLYGLVISASGTSARLVSIDPASGALTAIGAPFTVPVSLGYGFDFNPMIDRIRVVSEQNINLVVNPNDGTVTTQTALNPGDPYVLGAAYTNNFAGTTTTTLYGIDANTDFLVIQNPPAAGTLTNVGSGLGVNLSLDDAGFDISQCNGTAYAVLQTSGGSNTGLYTINLTTGAATLVGTTGANLRGLAVGLTAPTAQAMCSFTVTVQDTQAPTITCPVENVTITNTPDQCSAVVDYPDPIASDNCPGVTVSCTPPDGSIFLVGTTNVTCTASDTSPNSPDASCTFTVTVQDAQPPTITCPANIIVSADSATGSIVTFPAPTVSDNCPGVGAPVCTPASGSNFLPGTTTVSCTVADASPNSPDASCSFTITVNPGAPIGPGLAFPPTSEVSDQKAGSVLVYNLYSSSAASPNAQNTRFSITNINPSLDIAVHLFFVDGQTCSIADAIICLTKNQTATALASDLDPGTTGYLVAVASDLSTGCPVNFNFLIGDAYVKLASGHQANLGAEAFAALAAGPVVCDGNALTAQLNFDGVSYNRAPRVLAASSIPARNDGNDTLLVVNRFGGNLATGASTLTDLLGLFYDDAENGLSFTFSPGTCQFRSSLSSNFPRTTPRLDSFIPAGRTGWLRLYSTGDIGLLGAILNYNPTAGTAAGAFNQGRNLHKLTLTSTQTLVIPIFPPNCLN